MSDETAAVPPAFTPEQWAGVLADPHWWEYQGPQQGGWTNQPVITSRHGKAAVALYGQPYGFTADELDALDAGAVRSPAYTSAVEKVRALLPPDV